jgi:hypothetical protein
VGVDPKLWKALSKQKREAMMALIEADSDDDEGATASVPAAAVAARSLGDTTDALPAWSKADGTIDPAQVPADFRAGFVSIVGYPNAGKSTLMNKLLGEDLSIATAKAQTTRCQYASSHKCATNSLFPHFLERFPAAFAITRYISLALSLSRSLSLSLWAGTASWAWRRGRPFSWSTPTPQASCSPSTACTPR